MAKRIYKKHRRLLWALLALVLLLGLLGRLGA